jgi:predicted Zn-dependent peptidase
VHSYVNHYLDTGSTVVNAGVDPSKLDEALRATIDELLKMAEVIPDRELTKAKEFIKGRLQLRMEDTRAVASWLGGQELLRREILTVDEVLDIVDAVSAESLARVAAELWRPQAFRLAVVGPFRSESRFQKLLAA